MFYQRLQNGPWKVSKAVLYTLAHTLGSRPLVVVWCRSCGGVRDLPVGGGFVRSDWVSVNMMVLFADHGHRVAPVCTHRGQEREKTMHHPEHSNHLSNKLQYVIPAYTICTWVITVSETSTAQVDFPLFPHIFLHQTVEQKDKEP